MSEDNGNAANAKGFLSGKTCTGITSPLLSTLSQASPTGMRILNDSFLDPSSHYVEPVTTINPEKKIKLGDIVTTPKGLGIVVDIPNEVIAWIHLDGTPKDHEHGFQITKLERYMDDERANHNDLKDATYKENPFLGIQKSIKKDDGKYDPSMLTLEMVELVSRVRMFGAKKYARNNFKITGFQYTRSCAAALRHIFAFLNGEDLDPESGLSHIGHAICSLEHLVYDLKNHPENDDRRS